MQFLNDYKKDKHKAIPKNAFLLFMIFYLIGEIFGTLYFCLYNNPISQGTEYLWDMIVAAFFHGEFIQIFSAHFLAYAIPSILVLVFAYSTFGWALNPFITLIKGLFIGCFASFLCLTMGWQGFLIYMLFLWLPGMMALLMLLPLLYAGTVQALNLQRVCISAVPYVQNKRNCIFFFLCLLCAELVLCLGVGVGCNFYF